MRYLIFCCLIFLSGCEPIPWSEALGNHTCTEEQMKKVENETMWCSTNTAYLSEFCYGTAIIRNCVPMETSDG